MGEGRAIKQLKRGEMMPDMKGKKKKSSMMPVSKMMAKGMK